MIVLIVNKNIIRVLTDHEKRLEKLEKNTLEYQEINETGGLNKVKIILHGVKLKKERR